MFDHGFPLNLMVLKGRRDRQILDSGCICHTHARKSKRIIEDRSAFAILNYGKHTNEPKKINESSSAGVVFSVSQTFSC